LSKYQATLENARKEYNRAVRLLQNGDATSREEYDQRRATWLESEAGVRTARENILKTRAAPTPPLGPPEGKGRGEAPPGLEQNHPSVRAALSEMVVLGAQLGIELPRDVETPDQLLERLHILHPDGQYEEFVRKLVEDAPAIKVATADKEQAEADLAQAR